MEQQIESENYVVRFPKNDKVRGESRAGTSYVVFFLWLFVCGLWLYSEYKTIGEFNVRWKAECLTLAAPTVFFALASHILMKPVSERVIYVTGETFCFETNGIKGKSYSFSEITEVKTYSGLLVGNRALRTGEINYQIFVRQECVAIFTMEMENSWRLLQKLMEIGRVPGELAGKKNGKVS